MKKFLVTYDLKVQYMNPASSCHTRGDTVDKLKNIITTNNGIGTLNMAWGPEYSSNYAFVEAEDQDSAIEQFLTTYNSNERKVVKMMISDLNHVYKVPL